MALLLLGLAGPLHAEPANRAAGAVSSLITEVKTAVLDFLGWVDSSAQSSDEAGIDIEPNG